MNVGAGRFADVCDLVDKRNLGGKKRVVGVFDKLRRRPVRHDDGGFVEDQRAIDGLHHLPSALRTRADHHPVWLHEVINR